MSKFPFLRFILSVSPFFVPLVVYADIMDILDLGINAFDAVIPLFMTLATVVFLWGLVKFIAHAGDEKAVEEGKQVIIWGLTAIFVIVSLWGIVGFIQNTFLGSNPTGSVNPIQIPTKVP